MRRERERERENEKEKGRGWAGHTHVYVYGNGFCARIGCQKAGRQKKTMSLLKRLLKSVDGPNQTTNRRP